MFKIHHSLSIYEYEGKRYAEAWIFVKIFNKRFCFWKRREEIPERKPLMKVTIDGRELRKKIVHDALANGVKGAK